ncbi:WD40/YVTN/BNR-like repeat-containing protein [Sphingobacterium bovistauri]|uniref:Oxidoreductase n=1 Tax=Sphingobacterium bovistauri TaxID=2781959 RepID=A0ABS7Z2J1_9SPHI|nr:YCF48-related protein [Sphingobacterium bovistauri]MCA5003671.1 oxidoreductase [Sphingobacterium bovistauri]
MLSKIVLSTILLFSAFISSSAQTLTPLVENITASFRGMSTVGKNTVWVSGSNGTVGYTKDKGLTWNWVNPQGYEKYDFRDIYAFSNKEAIIVNAGSPAVVLRTTNAGKTWEKVYEDTRAEIFLDDMDFVGKQGYILGDPIDGKFQLLKTTNKGKTWKDISSNYFLIADEGEAAFAASGSSMKMFKDRLYIGTGGKYSSFFNYFPKGLKIDKYDVPIWSGESSTGIFAIDFWNHNKGIVVGGNYTQDTNNQNNILLTNDGGVSWSKPNTPVYGYRSDVLYLTENLLIATGTSGTDISYDGGYNWKNISKLSFNTIAKSSDNKMIYLTGSKGNVYKLTF